VSGFIVYVRNVYLFAKNHKKNLLYFVGIALLGGAVFLLSGHLFSNFDLMQLVVNRQQEFMNSKGYSDLQTPLLEPNVMSFIKNLPTALEHVFIEPIPQLGRKIKYDLTAFDSFIVIVLLSFGIFKLRREYWNNAYYNLILFYSVCCLLFIGYTIPNLGALVRYESPFICLLLVSIYSLGNFSLGKLSLK